MKEKLPRSYYYLLDFGDRNDKLIAEISGQYSLSKLTESQYLEYFEKATQIDIEFLKNL